MITISLFVINHFIGNNPQSQSNPFDVGVFLDRIFIIALIFMFFSFVFGVYTLIFTYFRGVNRYRDFSRRLNNLTDLGTFNLRTIEFPNEDEFGKIGTQFNSILRRLADFDDLKTQRLKMERQKFNIISDLLDLPVLFISLNGTDKVIKSYNQRFREYFTKKEDDQSFYEIDNNSLEALEAQCLPPKTKGYKPLIDKDMIEVVDTSIAVFSPTRIRRDFTSMNGKDKFHAERIDIIPVWDDFNQVGDILVIYHDIRKK